MPRVWLAGAAISLVALGGAEARAVEVPSSAAEPETTVSGVTVIGRPPLDYKVEDLTLPKLTQPLVDTPTIIATIPRQVIEDRNDTSLSEVFRHSSGISLGAGESSWQGTNLTLRGFNARNDLFLDGMRDFGSYYRDPFDLEEVDVLQGPSSILFGRGSTGGAINQVSKFPTLAPHLRAEATLGTDDTRRITADLDEPIPQLGDGAAFRLNVMGHQSGVDGRPEEEFHRYGVAPSLSLGLGTPTRFNFSYLHQDEDDVPDYGIPWFRGAPAPVPRSTFYGFDTDYLRTEADVATFRLEHDFSPALSVRTQLRYANYQRTWRDTEPQPVTTGVTAATPLTSVLVNRALQGGHSREIFLQDQTDITARFDTGFLHHTLVAGIEVGPESSSPEYDNGVGMPRATLLNPTIVPFSGTQFPRIIVKTTAFTTSGYVIDTVNVGPKIELTGGIRYDDFDSDYEAQNYAINTKTIAVSPTTHQSDKRDDALPSYRASAVYKATPSSSLYFDYSTSFNPSAEALSEIVAVRSLNAGNVNLPPEKNRVYEVGGKWDTLGKRLLLQAAIFREVKYNARIPDPNPADAGLNILGGDQRVDGFEVEAIGRVTARWQIDLSYTNLHSEVIKSGPGGPAVGQPLFNAPDNALAFWNTYQITDRLAVGGGLNLVSARYGQITNPVEKAPGYVTGDLMARYQLTPHLRLQANVYNLANTYYADELHGFHIIPGPGRSALFSLAVDY